MPWNFCRGGVGFDCRSAGSCITPGQHEGRPEQPEGGLLSESLALSMSILGGFNECGGRPLEGRRGQVLEPLASAKSNLCELWRTLPYDFTREAGIGKWPKVTPWVSNRLSKERNYNADDLAVPR